MNLHGTGGFRDCFTESQAASCKHFQSQNHRFRVYEGGYWKDFQNQKILSKEHAKTLSLTVATLAYQFAVRRSNCSARTHPKVGQISSTNSARNHPQTPLDIIHKFDQISPANSDSIHKLGQISSTNSSRYHHKLGQISSTNSSKYRPQTRLVLNHKLLQISSTNSARSSTNSARYHPQTPLLQTRLVLNHKLLYISPQTRLDIIHKLLQISPQTRLDHPQTRLSIIHKLLYLSFTNSTRSHPQAPIDIIHKLGQISSTNSARSHSLVLFLIFMLILTSVPPKYTVDEKDSTPTSNAGGRGGGGSMQALHYLQPFNSGSCIFFIERV